MRLVQLLVPDGERARIQRVLDEHDVEYAVTAEASDRELTAVVSFPLPDAAVEPILDALHEAGMSDDTFTVVVDAETVVSEKFEALAEHYEKNHVEEDRISRQELRTRAEDLTPTLPTFVTLTIVSAVVATAGMLLDSAAVVVGAMVIAPLIGPALGASVGTVLDERELLHTALKYQAIGIVAAVASAAAFAWLVRTALVVPPGLNVVAVDEIAERLSPDLLSLVIALGAGIAGVLSITTGVSVALVGVMIAAALIPPAAAAGIAIAWELPMAATGASVLLFVNVLGVNLAGIVTLWYVGYRPGGFFDSRELRRRVIQHAAILAAVVLLFSAFLGVITYGSYQHAVFEEGARDDVRAVLDEPAFEDLRLVDVDVFLDDDFPVRSPDRVVVTIERPSGQQYPALVGRINERIDERANGEVTVQIRYVDVVER